MGAESADTTLIPVAGEHQAALRAGASMLVWGMSRRTIILRRASITRALDQGLAFREVQLMSDHADPKTLMRYDRGRKRIRNNTINRLNYDEA